MQVNLKKSLYLGLAALTFASVAGASTASATTANAASHHHVVKATKKHAKKATKKTTKKAAKAVTFKVTKNLDQSLVYKSTGKNAMFTKPGGVKNNKLKASKNDMRSKANSNSANDLFMAYQEVRTSKGVHYYKVVSFDKKVRGYVYVKGVQKIDNPTTTAAKPANTTGYVTTNNIYNLPVGYRFGADSSIKDFNGINFSADKFNVNSAVTVYGGDTYYNVTDQSNPLINGWVKASDFSNNMPDSVKNAQNTAQNAANAVNVTFVDSSKIGSTYAVKSLNPTLNGNGNYNINDVVNSINDSLKGSGYQANLNSSDITDNTQNNAKLSSLSFVNKGDKLSVLITPDNSRTSLTYSISQLQNKGTLNQTLATLTKGHLNNVRISDNLKNSLFNGANNQAFDYNNFKNQLLVAGAPMSKFTSNDGKYTYNFDASMTETNGANPKLFNNNNQLINNATFNDVSTQSSTINGTTFNGLNLVYDVVDNSTGQVISTTPTGYSDLF